METQVYACRLPAGVANTNVEPGFEDCSDTHQGEWYLQLNGIYSIAYLEQLLICVRTVNDNLEVLEHFLGFYKISNIRSKTIVTAIKDALIQMQLPLLSYRGQTYNGASNMLGKKPGVAAKILNEVPKALPTHCHAHSKFFYQEHLSKRENFK